MPSGRGAHRRASTINGRRDADFRHGRLLSGSGQVVGRRVARISSLNLTHVRCKSPEMVRRELWTTLLGYNPIRTTAAAAAVLHDKQPRQISFTGTCQYVLASWPLLSAGVIPADECESRCRILLEHIANCEVANRPGRLEPRVLKRRRHGYKLMQKPRHVLTNELRKQCT